MQNKNCGMNRRFAVAISLLTVSLAVVGVSRSNGPLSLRLLGGSPPPPDFSIAGTVSGLAPGNTSSSLKVTVTDNLKATVTVTAITAQITSATYVKDGSTAPSICVTYLSPTFIAAPSSSLNSPYPYSYTWTGLNLQPSGSGGQASVSEPFTFGDTPKSDQSSCENVKFAITYSTPQGTASYGEIFVTGTGLTSSNNPSSIGQSVTYIATVTATATSSQDSVPSSPTGSVTFKDGATTICTVALPPPTAGGRTATAQCSPAAYIANGTHPITAAYTNADGNFAGSSGALTQKINTTPPSQCTGSYNNTIVATPSNTTVNGTSGNDLIFAFGANYTVSGNQGNDCLSIGDGNNTLTDGNGNDTIVAGNGTNTITVGNGTDWITVGAGSANRVTLGNGIDTVSMQGSSTSTITGGNGNETIYLGGGTYNTYSGGKGTNVCHVPSPGASALHDTLQNCAVVTP